MHDGPVFWHQGLFLQPQHFQLTDARTEGLLADLASSLRPWCWGVMKCALDSKALLAGSVEVSELEALFPGCGEQLDVPGNAVIQSRSVPERVADVGGEFTVWALLPQGVPGEANVTLASDAAGLAEAKTVWACPAEPEEVPDLYERGPAGHVRRLKRVIRLAFGSEAEASGSVSRMPVCRLRRVQQGYEQVPDFAPPCLALQDSPLLFSLVRSVRDAVVAKTADLNGLKLQVRRGNLGDLTSLFMILRSLSRFCARLTLVCDTPVVPPFEAYRQLSELAAELVVFTGDFSDRDPATESAVREDSAVALPAYDHNDCAPAFTTLKTIIFRLLDSLSTGPRYLLRFEQAVGMLHLSFAADVLDNPSGRNEYWVVLHCPHTNLGDLARELRHVKVAAASDMPSLVARALPSLPFSVESQPPLGLSRKEGDMYLKLVTTSPLWSGVQHEHGLALSWPEAPEGLEAWFAVLEV